LKSKFLKGGEMHEKVVSTFGSFNCYGVSF
jgi:hypothetical protein